MTFDLMRLIAALLVVVSHTFPLSGQPALEIMGVEDFGALGVSIFFVISGYLVTASYQRNPRTYILKRLLRIEPALIASLVLTVLVLSRVTTATPAEYWPAAGMYVLRNAALYPATYYLPGVFQSVPVAGVVNGVLWTLRLEFSFYLLLLLVGARRSFVMFILLICAILWASLHDAAPHWAADKLTRIVFLTARNGFLFFAGAALQLVGKRVPLWLGIASALVFPFAGVTVLPTAVLGLSRPGKLPADLSYGIYIYAFPVQQLLAQAGKLNILTAVLAVVPFAVASWFLIERPAQRLKPGPPPAW
ncbi:MAG: acyltransferase [Caulobacterales bacterium]|nr:acyltransferase [Caulobacterales bacterium]